jgi:ribosomal protein S18 acetylase RimI-like enzyme
MSPMNILVRPAEERDVGGLAELMAELGYPISLPDMKNRFTFITASAHDELFVAEIDGRVVGLIGVQIAEFIHRVARYGIITALAVSADYRRQGIGSHLLRHAEAVLKEKDVVDVRVSAGIHRQHEAHKFYRASGCQVIGYRFTKTLR